MQSKIYSTTMGGKEVTIEVGKYAMQADGHCIVRCGETAVMVNVTVADQPKEGQDFFPLSVDFEEKLYSVGKIPGGYKKREGKASDKAILTSRLIDRPLRPLFPKHFFNDVVIVATALSVDPDVAPEALAMLGSSAALMMSSAPFEGPVGAVNIALVDGQLIANPNAEQREKSDLNLTVGGTKDAILMVEAGANFVTEEKMLEAILFAHEEIKKQIPVQLEIAKDFGKEKKQPEVATPEELEFEEKVIEFARPLIAYSLETYDRQERQKRDKEAREKCYEEFCCDCCEGIDKWIDEILYQETKRQVRANTMTKGVRIDGRNLDQVRPIWCEVGILPRVHGSGVFTRGQTQVLTTCTLGMLSDVQKLDGIDDEEQKRYMHHYNMPPYSTGEARMLRSPGRREIGHGALAERALEPVLPSEEEFPYAIRTVSEVLSSNGSTSQASVCGSTLALMDAGVPISSPVAGVAMGLMKNPETNEVFVLTDIQGEEDFFGDMDFKVAGTESGITAIQMDIKIKGIDEAILRTALEKAKKGRMHIMGEMLKVITEPRAELNKYAPKIISFNIDPDKIRDVIGTGGKVINRIIEETGVKIDITDDGVVCVGSDNAEKMQQAKSIILAITSDVEKGTHFVGKVVKTMNFGAFVEFVPGREGLVHISKLSDKRVEKTEDVVVEGDKVEVEVLGMDKNGKVDLKLVKKF